jgi:uncharacterized protein
MVIDWAHFTPFSALAGGTLIGLAAALLILGLGRIMGAAGVVGAALEISGPDRQWRWSLIAGLALSPLVARALWSVAPPVFAVPGLALVASGLLVGFGARLGSGCTSGHGVCGLARSSPRSFAATATFMAMAFATVFVVRHVLG